MIIVAMTPTMRPLLQNAFGIAKIPVPRLPFSRCTRVAKFLEKRRHIFILEKYKKKEYSITNIFICNVALFSVNYNLYLRSWIRYIPMLMRIVILRVSIWILFGSFGYIYTIIYIVCVYVCNFIILPAFEWRKCNK